MPAYIVNYLPLEDIGGMGDVAPESNHHVVADRHVGGQSRKDTRGSEARGYGWRHIADGTTGCWVRKANVVDLSRGKHACNSTS